MNPKLKKWIIRLIIIVLVVSIILPTALFLNVKPTQAAIAQTGSNTEFNISTANSGTVSSTITVPADAEMVIVGISGYQSSANYFSAGSMTFTKGGIDTAMTSAGGGGDSDNAAFYSAMFYMVSPDTGSNKTLKWNWLGSSTATDAPVISVTFWKGINTSTPVRGSGGGQNASGTPYTSSSITAQSGDTIVAWAGGYVVGEGTINTWSNLSLLAQVTHYNNADGAWATGTPSGNTTVAASTNTNYQDGGIIAISLIPAAAGTPTDTPTLTPTPTTPPGSPPTVGQHTDSGLLFNVNSLDAVFSSIPTNNDIILLGYAHQGTASRTWPSGFTEFANGDGGTGMYVSLAWKRAASEGSATYTLNLGSTADSNQELFGWTVQGAITSGSPIDVAGTVESAFGIPQTVTSITTLTNHDIHFIFVGSSDSGSTLAATGYTLVGEGEFSRTAAIYKTFSFAGATGDIPISGITDVGDNTWLSFAIKPDAATPTPRPVKYNIRQKVNLRGGVNLR